MIFITKTTTGLAMLLASNLGMAATIRASADADTAAAAAQVGDMTYYDPSASGNQVACGGFYGPGDRIAAVGAGSFGSGSACGKTATISYNGKTTTATIVDLCGGCATGDIDVTPTVFEQLAPTSAGRIPGVSWTSS